jgi:hypothetical protein
MKFLRCVPSNFAAEASSETVDDCISPSPLNWTNMDGGWRWNLCVGPSSLGKILGAEQRTRNYGESGAANALFCAVLIWLLSRFWFFDTFPYGRVRRNE